MFPEIFLAVVCPMANEQETAASFVRDVIIQCRFSGFKKIVFFAVLDHASTDGTKSILEGLDFPELEIIWAPENRCVVDAYVTGYRAALESDCDWILEIDAGYSHRPEQIPRLLTEMARGNDAVFGSRFVTGGTMRDNSFKRRAISKVGSILSRVLLNAPMNDMTSGFQLFTRETLEMILRKGIFSRGPFFQTEMKAYCRRLQTVEVPITYRAGSHGIGQSAIADSIVGLLRLCRMRLRGTL